MPHRNSCDRNLTPALRRPNNSADFTGQFHPCSFTESKPSNILIEFLVTDTEREFGRADVTRFHQNILHAQFAICLVVVQWPAPKIPSAIFAKNCCVGSHLLLVHSRRRGYTFERR